MRRSVNSQASLRVLPRGYLHAWTVEPADTGCGGLALGTLRRPELDV